MKTVRWLWMGFLLCFWGCEDPAPKRTLPLSSRVELAAGDVWLAEGAGKKRLITGAMLAQEAEVFVGKGGRALIRLDTGVGTFLREGTRVKMAGGSVGLLQGELWADVPAGDQEMNRFTASNYRLHQNMVIRLLNITVEKLHLLSILQGKGKAGCHQCLAGASFTAGNRNNHQRSNMGLNDPESCSLINLSCVRSFFLSNSTSIATCSFSSFMLCSRSFCSEASSVASILS